VFPPVPRGYLATHAPPLHQREDATERLSELRDASTESLASAGDEFENALDELEAAIDRLDRRLREEA
jgi:hypothetical protein